MFDLAAPAVYVREDADWVAETGDIELPHAAILMAPIVVHVHVD